MTIDEFNQAIGQLGWKGADFCRMTGVHRNTVSRWRHDEAPIPEWVAKHLELLLEVKRLHSKYLEPTQLDSGVELAS